MSVFFWTVGGANQNVVSLTILHLDQYCVVSQGEGMNKSESHGALVELVQHWCVYTYLVFIHLSILGI